MPKFSVIVPVYNTEKYLKKCIDSIINQTFNDYEIIIINDGSTDNSKKIIEEYKYNNRVKSYNKKNGGLSSARNYGIKKAEGEYVLFVDSDDYIDENLLAVLVSYTNKKTDLIKFKCISVDEKYNIIKKNDGPIFEDMTGKEAFEELAFKDKLMEPSCLYCYNMNFFRKNKFKFAEGLYHEDCGLTPIIISNSKSVYSINFYGYYYVQVQNSITRNNDYNKTLKRVNDLLFHYDNMINRVKNNNLKEKEVNNLKLFYTNVILNALGYLEKKDLIKIKKEIKKRKLIKNLKYRRGLKKYLKIMYYKLIWG